MHQEIERKYKVIGEDYKSLASEVWHIRQGYLCRDKERTIRIRAVSPIPHNSQLTTNSAILNIKGPARGISRFEYEHEVPQDVAEELFALCLPSVIEKDRYLVPWEEVVIEVDVFHGKHEGLVFAEIELQSEDQVVNLPDWLGEEVTHDPHYSNAYLSLHISAKGQ